MSGDACVPATRVPPETCVFPLPRSSYADPSSIRPLLTCHLFALDKHPGVGPIGIGDTARRIIAKAVLPIAATDIQDASGCLQLFVWWSNLWH